MQDIRALGQVDIWAKPGPAYKDQREDEEERLINRLGTVWNRRRRKRAQSSFVEKAGDKAATLSRQITVKTWLDNDGTIQMTAKEFGILSIAKSNSLYPKLIELARRS